MRDLLLFWRHRFKSHKGISKFSTRGIKICDRGGSSLLGSPIFDQGFKNTVEKTIITVENLLNKAELLSRHVAYTLIKNCLFIPKFNFLLRTLRFKFKKMSLLDYVHVNKVSKNEKKMTINVIQHDDKL
jgi:hypothetical protein